MNERRSTFRDMYASIVQLPGPSPEGVWLAASVDGTKRAFCGVKLAEPGPAAKEVPMNC